MYTSKIQSIRMKSENMQTSSLKNEISCDKLCYITYLL